MHLQTAWEVEGGNRTGPAGTAYIIIMYQDSCHTVIICMFMHAVLGQVSHFSPIILPPAGGCAPGRGLQRRQQRKRGERMQGRMHVFFCAEGNSVPEPRVGLAWEFEEAAFANG